MVLLVESTTTSNQDVVTTIVVVLVMHPIFLSTMAVVRVTTAMTMALGG